MRNYKLYLKDILEAMTAIEKFVEGMEFDEFKQDDKSSSAVVRKFEVIGEATKNIPESLRTKYSDVPWKEMAGMRDKLIQFYFGIDFNLVWQAIKHRIPTLKQEISKILEEVES